MINTLRVMFISSSIIAGTVLILLFGVFQPDDDKKSGDDVDKDRD